MPSAKLKPLYMGSTISDLTDKFNISDKASGGKPNLLCNTAQKLFHEAVKSEESGDEEKGYVWFMKFLNVARAVQRTPDFKKNQIFYSQLLSKTNVDHALEHAEYLAKSLEMRYKEKSDQLKDQLINQEREEEFEEEEALRTSSDQSSVASNGLENIADVSDISLSSNRLRYMIHVKDKRVLILDARPKESFDESHMSYKSCISVPEEIITPGMSAAALEKNLPAQSKEIFGNRSLANFVVLLDWSTTSKNFTPGSHLYTLKNILLKWDPNIIYKIEPLILEGGYDDWLLKYPTYTTNPHAKPPSVSLILDDLLSDINYPSLNDNLPDRSLKPTSVPGVDRGSKAMAVQTYEEKNKMIADLLEASEKGADSSLQLEKTRLIAEQEWDGIRSRKELEAEEEIKSQLQVREEELLLSIAKLETIQREKDEENQQLRDQLEEYKRREVEEAEVEQKQRIVNMENEAKAIAQQREIIAKERTRKVAEDRKKRKYQEQMKRESEKSNGPKTTPQFDRTVKPLPKVHRTTEVKRNFNPVLGKVMKGITGLKNLGNTCYMNSILQCINNTPQLCDYFTEGSWKQDVNYNTKTHGEIVQEVAAVVRALWQGQFRSMSCLDLKHVVGQHKEEYRGYQQQDSHEFLFFLINLLHDDLNKRTNKSLMKNNLKGEQLTDEAKHWAEFERCNESMILQLFYGQTKTVIRCLKCSETSINYQQFNHLTLPIPNSNGRCNLNDCIKLYLAGERITGFKCEKCRAMCDAVLQIDICKLPPILVLHFNRFVHDGWTRKRANLVDFPLENLNMQVYTSQPNQLHTKYDLYGVSNHYGTMEGGHYTAYCKNRLHGRWYKFDDTEVTEMSNSDVRSNAAYILFYTSTNNKVPYVR